MKMNSDCFSGEHIGKASLELTKWCSLMLLMFSIIIQTAAVYSVSKCFSIKHLFCLFIFVSTNFSFRHPVSTRHAHR